MSVSVTTPETLKSVSFALAVLSAQSASEGPAKKLSQHAHELISGLCEEGVDSLSVEARAALLFEHMRQANLASVARRYPDQADTLPKPERVSAASMAQSRRDYEVPLVPLQASGLRYLSAAFDRVDQGLDDDDDNKLLLTHLHAMDKLVAPALFELHAQNIPAPKVPDVAESMLRLSYGGDYFYGVQNGMKSSLGRLFVASNGATYHESEMLLHLLQEIRRPIPITVPHSYDHYDMPRVDMKTPMQLSPHDYVVAADVPPPTRDDVINVAMAMREVNNAVQNLEDGDAISPDGVPFTKVRQSGLRNKLQEAAFSHLRAALHNELSYDGELSYPQAHARYQAHRQPQQVLHIVGDIDQLTKLAASRATVQRENDTELLFAAHQLKGFDLFDSEDQAQHVVANTDHAITLPMPVSRQAMIELQARGVRFGSANLVLMRRALEGAEKQHGPLAGGPSRLTSGQIASIVAQAWAPILRGGESYVREQVPDILKNYGVSTPARLVDVFAAKLPESAQVALAKPEFSRVLKQDAPAPTAPEHEDDTAPQLRRSR